MQPHSKFSRMLFTIANSRKKSQSAPLTTLLHRTVGERNKKIATMDTILQKAIIVSFHQMKSDLYFGMNYQYDMNLITSCSSLRQSQPLKVLYLSQLIKVDIKQFHFISSRLR